MRKILDINDFIEYNLKMLDVLGDAPDMQDCIDLRLINQTCGMRIHANGYVQATIGRLSYLHVEVTHGGIRVAFSPVKIRISGADHPLMYIDCDIGEEDFFEKFTLNGSALEYRSIEALFRIHNKFLYLADTVKPTWNHPNE